ncbi:MAG: Hpt domain-containing protein [Spirochaetales bacterium]
MDAEITALTGQFYADLEEHADSMEALLLRLESDRNDAESLHALFRAFHTVKGNAGLVGEIDIQAACHALESELSEARGHGVTNELIDRSFKVVDILRSCARSGSASECGPRLREIASRSWAHASETRDEARSGPNGADLGENTGPAVRAGGSDRSGTEAGEARDEPTVGMNLHSLSLAEFRRLVAGFGQLRQAVRAFERRAAGGDAAERAVLLRDVGMAAIEFLDDVPECRPRIRAVGRYLEELMNLVLMSGFDYDPDRFPLLSHLVSDLEQMVKGELVNAPFLTSILVDEAHTADLLPDALERLVEPQLVAVQIRVSFDRLARSGTALERIAEAGRHPRHTVFFVTDDGERATQATRFLSEALGGYPLVGSSIWEAILHAIVPEE